MRYVTIAVILCFAVTPIMYAQQQNNVPKKVRKELNLTDAQKKSLQDIRNSTGKKMIDITSSMKKKRIDLKSMMMDNTPNRGGIEKLMNEIADLKVQRNMLMFDTKQSTMKIFTDEQKEILKNMRKNKRPGRGNRIKSMRDRRGGCMGSPGMPGFGRGLGYPEMGTMEMNPPEMDDLYFGDMMMPMDDMPMPPEDIDDN